MMQTEQSTQPEQPTPGNNQIKTLALRLWAQISAVSKTFLGDRFSIIDNADPEATIAGIKKDIEFKGFNLWILIFSIIIASIGLNVNSTAVVIGAMLISPLMGPIMGVGLALGINDIDTFWRSLKSLGVAVGISLLASALYFAISPISTPSHELFSRTNPTLLDVLVAFFGGLAGILAGSRKEKNNVIPGVAIATALMPPLATAGYGLANGEWHYLIGAFYLFVINSILIATSTLLVVRYLRFPMATFLDPAKEKRARRWITFMLIVVIVPSGWILFRTVSNSLAERNVEEFITENVQFPGTEIVKKEIDFAGANPQVSIVLFGEQVPSNLVEQWTTTFKTELNGTLSIVQGKGQEGLQEMSKLVNLYTQGREEALGYQEQISALEAEVASYESQLIPHNLHKEIMANYPEVASITMGSLQTGLSANSDGTTIPAVYLTWQETVSDSTKSVRSAQLYSWLLLRLDTDTLVLR